MVRDVFHVSGFLCFDAFGPVVAIVLSQEAYLARSFIRPLQALLAPLHGVVNLGETQVAYLRKMGKTVEVAKTAEENYPQEA